MIFLLSIYIDDNLKEAFYLLLSLIYEVIIEIICNFFRLGDEAICRFNKGWWFAQFIFTHWTWQTGLYFGKQAFMLSASAVWSHLQTDLQLQELTLVRAFKNVVKSLEASIGVCNCLPS